MKPNTLLSKSDLAEPGQNLIEVSLEITQELLSMLGEAWGQIDDLQLEVCRLRRELEEEYAHHDYHYEGDRDLADGVVIIDDSRLMVEHLRNILNTLGYRVLGIAGDGVAGAEMVISLNPKLVILDHIMPRMDGLECLRSFRMQCRQTRVIVCSDEKEKVLSNAYAFGDVSAIIPKPIQLDRFARVVRQCMNVDCQAFNTRIGSAG